MTTDLVKKGRPTTRRSTKGKRKAGKNSFMDARKAAQKRKAKSFQYTRIGDKTPTTYKLSTIRNGIYFYKAEDKH